MQKFIQQSSENEQNNPSKLTSDRWKTMYIMENICCKTQGTMDVKKCTQVVKTTISHLESKNRRKRLTGHLFSKGTHNQKCGNKFKKHSTQRGEGINNTQRLHVII